MKQKYDNISVAISELIVWPSSRIMLDFPAHIDRTEPGEPLQTRNVSAIGSQRRLSIPAWCSTEGLKNVSCPPRAHTQTFCPALSKSFRNPVKLGPNHTKLHWRHLNNCEQAGILRVPSCHLLQTIFFRGFLRMHLDHRQKYWASCRICNIFLVQRLIHANDEYSALSRVTGGDKERLQGCGNSVQLSSSVKSLSSISNPP